MIEATSNNKQAMVEIRGLTRNFNTVRALNGVSIRLEERNALAIIGTSGSGTTTLIKHVVGLLRPQAGHVRVFGQDPVVSPEHVLSRVGYVTEGELGAPPSACLGTLMEFKQSLYPSWNQERANQLRERFELSEGTTVRGC
jgi:ABC-type multidrug transport system ATPase subunit